MILPKPKEPTQTTIAEKAMSCQYVLGCHVQNQVGGITIRLLELSYMYYNIERPREEDPPAASPNQTSCFGVWVYHEILGT